MKIYIESLSFKTIVGLLDFERVTPQELIVDVEIDYSYNNEFINYAEVAQEIENFIQKKQFLLLEDALLQTSEHLYKKFPTMQILFLKLTKPSILPHCKVALSEIFVFHS